ncbi:hypothetical protein, variant 2 [Verruconis gallopava]|uniref:Peptidase A1 domain-containing protein n=1 Tax=Verruconis gallopava TaxID=253628 RepID=A0A0D1YTC1_9PEZI|nr:hypothetical protein, variant 1 [Verruconis gallopava]XP_016213762.1 hypothetical protein, variant 2 [Verruconis gallopava]KIW03892.1 hypothetical protein, variant 1 [Verruconis gallopava]KIW03893.1 hypothetical protein, variant 2 [Verruconis gallopava]
MVSSPRSLSFIYVCDFQLHPVLIFIMHTISSVTLLAGFVGFTGFSFAAPFDANANSAGAFRVEQVQGSTVLKNGAAAIQKAYVKYNKQTPANVAKAAASGTVTANPEQYDSEYLCPVTVGSTTLNLDFDTGSADLWVFSDKLPAREQGQHDLYSTSSGKRLSGETWSITYGDGSGASGIVYADKVVIGGVTATSQAVEAATSVSSQFVQDTANDGLVGLAFSSINTVRPNPATTFFDTVKSSLQTQLFAADLKKGAAGYYDFGYIDTSKFTGDLVYADVDDSQGFWMFNADGYAIGGSQQNSQMTGIADTGTTLLLIDSDVVDAYCTYYKSS